MQTPLSIVHLPCTRLSATQSPMASRASSLSVLCYQHTHAVTEWPTPAMSSSRCQEQSAAQCTAQQQPSSWCPWSGDGALVHPEGARSILSHLSARKQEKVCWQSSRTTSTRHGRICPEEPQLTAEKKVLHRTPLPVRPGTAHMREHELNGQQGVPARPLHKLAPATDPCTAKSTPPLGGATAGVQRGELCLLS